MEREKISKLLRIIAVLKAEKDQKTIRWNYISRGDGTSVVATIDDKNAPSTSVSIGIKINGEERFYIESAKIVEILKSNVNQQIANKKIHDILLEEIEVEFGDVLEALRRSNPYSSAIDGLYQLAIDYLGEQKYLVEEEREKRLQDNIDIFLYAAAVTKMKYDDHQQQLKNPTKLLGQICGFTMPKTNELSVTRSGSARAISDQILGCRINKKGAKRTLRDLFAARIEAIDLIDRLYEEMTKSGKLYNNNPQNNNQKNTFEKFKEIKGRPLDNYLSSIIFDANSLVKITNKNQVPLVNKCLNPRVSLAILNHFMSNQPFQIYPVQGTLALETLKKGMSLAISESEKILQRLAAQRQEGELYNYALTSVYDVTLHRGNLEQLREGMISGLTPVEQGDMEIGGELSASTSIGKVEENQEDAVLLIEDDIIPGFKMMVVADGMGGMDRGEVASHMVIEELRKWFKSLEIRDKSVYYNDIEMMRDSLNNIIREISKKITENLGKESGSTIVCAVIGKYKTLIANVGDSRAYIVKDGILMQVSRDDSATQFLLPDYSNYTKEELRFYIGANAITDAVGAGYSTNVKFKTLLNSKYDRLILLSDGATDCLSDEAIALIAKGTDGGALAHKIMSYALDSYSLQPSSIEGKEGFNQFIRGGKDNTTVAVFSPKNGESR